LLFENMKIMVESAAVKQKNAEEMIMKQEADHAVEI